MGADGVASAVAPGEVDLRANYGGVSSPAVRITVLADGTFKVSGLITDSDAVQPIVGATVEIEQGIGAGLRSTTDANGAYALYGAAGEIRVAVSSPRFVSRNEAFTVSAPLTRNFVLSGEPSSSDLTGRWQLTFADPGCTALPEPMRTRQFTTTIAHSGSRAVLLLSGSTLIVTDPLNGRVFGDLLTVPLPHWPGDVIDAPYYAVLEQVHPGYLGIRGTITVALNGEGLDGTLDGALDYYPAAFTAGSAVGCSGPKAVKLRRQ
jgi:hypothetical protein